MDTAILIRETTAQMIAAQIATTPEIVAASARRHFKRGAMQGYVINVKPAGGPSHDITESELEAFYA